MLRFRIALVALLSVFIATTAAFAKPFEFKDITLDNGLRVITLEDFSTPIVAVQVWYHVGSKNEQASRQGFAHMFEHMMFRGTDLIKPEEDATMIRKAGGDSNAFTSFDHTTFVSSAPSNQLELLIWLESQRMFFLKIDQEGFDTERKVVEEERRMGLNQPYGSVFEQVLPVMFKQHPYRWSPIGNIPDLNATKLSELIQFWDYFYVPQNATLVIAGAVSHADAEAMAKKYFGWMPSGDTSKRPTFSEPEQKEPREVSIEEPFGPVPMVVEVYRSVPAKDPDAIPLDLLMIVLGKGDSSRMYKDLVKAKQMFAQEQADTYTLEDAGVFGAGGALNPGVDPAAALKAVEEHLAQLREQPIADRELTKAKNQLRRQVVTDSLTVYSKAEALGDAALTHGSPEWVNDQLGKIDAVTLDDLTRVAKKYIVPERRTTVKVMPNPNKKLDDIVGGAPTTGDDKTPNWTNPKEGVKLPDWFPKTAPFHPLLDELPQPPMQDATLENGLRVVIVPNHEVPYVSLMLGSKYGAWAEDPSTPGVASMALSMLTKGTKPHTAAELAEIIEFNALTLDGSATMDVAEVSATCLSEKLPLAVSLLGEVAQEPTFPKEELGLLKQQRFSELSVRDQDPDYAAEQELRKRLYGNHPYSRTAEGDLADVAKLTPDLLSKFWSTYGRPDGCILYIAGDVQPDQALDLAKKAFGAWKANGPAPKVAMPEMPKIDKTQIYLVDRPGAVQSQIRVAETSITRDNPDYHLTRVFSQIYGGAFDSRLNKVIRTERGLTYGASGGFRPNRFCGEFSSNTFTKTESTAETVQALLDVMKTMQDTPPSDAELDTAKSFLVGGFPSQLETPQDAVTFQWIIDYMGLPRDYLNQAVQHYKGATKDDIMRVAHQYVDPAKLVIVVAGEASKVKEGLEKIAPVTVIEPPAPVAPKKGVKADSKPDHSK